MENQVTGTSGTSGDTAVKRTKKVEAVDPMKAQVAAMYTRYNGNINAVASSLMIPKHVVEKYLQDENI